MFRQTRFAVILGLAVILVVALLLFRVAWREPHQPSLSPLTAAGQLTLRMPSPLDTPTAAPLYSPLPVPPTAIPPIGAATLEAIRTIRPSATPLAPSRVQWPYVSPATWRTWALRILAAAGLLGYIGLRLRHNQKT